MHIYPINSYARVYGLCSALVLLPALVACSQQEVSSPPVEDTPLLEDSPRETLEAPPASSEAEPPFQQAPLIPKNVGGAGGQSANPTAEQEEDEATGWAILVGISDYPPMGPDHNDLAHAHDDAIDWYHFLLGRGYKPQNIQLFGDSQPENYPQYDGAAYKKTVLDAIVDVAARADDNDHIVFASSGHGLGDGSEQSALMMMDGNASWERDMLHDTELAEAFSGSAARTFLFLDHCFAGGIGPDFLALSMPQRFYVSTSCAADGLGYDGDENGLWTGQFLEQFAEFAVHEKPSVESVFAAAAESFVVQAPSPDAPLEFDGDPTNDFFIGDSLADTVQATAFGARHLPLQRAESLGHSISSARRAHIVPAPPSGALGFELSSQKLSALLQEIDLEQIPSSSASRCWVDTRVVLTDGQGEELASIGFCRSSSGDLKREGILFLGTGFERQGIQFPDLAAIEDLVTSK